MSLPLRLVGLCSIVLLGGCALGERMAQLGDAISLAQHQIASQHTAFAQTVASDSARKAAQHVQRPWLMGRAQPLAREVTLPAALRANVSTTLLFPGDDVALGVIAQRISMATGLPVKVQPEALLPASNFLPRIESAASATAINSGGATMRLQGGPEPLARILDRIATHLGISWRYHNQRIEFYRTLTRVFSIRALTLNASADASLGLASQSDAQGFVSSSRTRLESGVINVLDTIRARIEPFLTRAGVLAVQPGASGSIVVTDTPEVLENIARYLDAENRSMTRRVRLVFEELTVLVDDTAEAGIDWNLVFSSASFAAGMAVGGAGVAEAGMLEMGLTRGPFKGSEAIVKALGQVGKVVRRSSLPVLTLNRRPVTHAVRTTFSYIDKVETTALGAQAALALPSVSVSQREQTVGSMLTLVPDAQDNGQVLLSVAYDNTVAQPLKSVTFGDKANPLQLQQITIDGNGTIQQVALQPGQPLLISGFDRSEQETAERRLNPGMPVALGGSNRASKQSLTTVMIVTAQVEDGF